MTGPIRERGSRIGVCEFRVDGQALVLDYAALCGGRGDYIYPQQELVGDWTEQLLAAGGDLRFCVEVTGVDQDEDGALVTAVLTSARGAHGDSPTRTELRGPRETTSLAKRPRLTELRQLERVRASKILCDV